MRKLFLAIAILAIVAVSSSIIFYACQKEDGKASNLENNTLLSQKAASGSGSGDTTYIAGEAGDHLNFCDGGGQGCLPNVTIHGSRYMMEHANQVFTDLITSDNNEGKQVIVRNDRDLFIQFIPEEWINRILENTYRFDVRKTTHTLNRFVFSFYAGNEDEGSRPEQLLPVVLIVEE